MPLIQRDAAFLHNARDNPRFGHARTNRANASVPLRDLINFRTHFRRREKGVLAPVHWRAAGMRRLPAKSDRVPFHAEGPQHGAQRQIKVQQHRPLFDVQLQVSRGVFKLLAAIFHALEIDADPLQRIRQSNAVFVLETARFVEVQVARTR